MDSMTPCSRSSAEIASSGSVEGIPWTIPLISVSDLVFMTLITTLPKEVLLRANRAFFCFSSMGWTKRSPREARRVDLTLPTDCSIQFNEGCQVGEGKFFEAEIGVRGRNDDREAGRAVAYY